MDGVEVYTYGVDGVWCYGVAMLMLVLVLDLVLVLVEVDDDGGDDDAGDAAAHALELGYDLRVHGREIPFLDHECRVHEALVGCVVLVWHSAGDTYFYSCSYFYSDSHIHPPPSSHVFSVSVSRSIQHDYPRYHCSHHPETLSLADTSLDREAARQTHHISHPEPRFGGQERDLSHHASEVEEAGSSSAS